MSSKFKHIAPIALFVYNRPTHTLKCLEALCNNKLAAFSNLYIFSDGPKPNASEDELNDISEVRRIIRNKSWCKNTFIEERTNNVGLADSIISGVTKLIDLYGSVIVLEDDLVISPSFLLYMNDALLMYENDNKVMHISAYLPVTSGAEHLPDTFFLRFMSCWGWATWKRAWRQIELDSRTLNDKLLLRSDLKEYNLDGCVDIQDQLIRNISGEIKTWAVKWYTTIFLNNGLCLYPKQSLVAQIGLDGTGTNCVKLDDNKFEVSLNFDVNVQRQQLCESQKAKQYLKRFYKYGRYSTLKDQIIYYRKSFLNYFYRKIYNY